MDHLQSNCLNESAEHKLKLIMQSPKEPESYLLSDADEQLLLNVSVSLTLYRVCETHYKPCPQFHQTVRIKALRVYSRIPSQGPLVVKVLVNQPSIGFEDVEGVQEQEAVQVVRLSEEDVGVGKQIPLRFVRFQSVSSVHVSTSFSYGVDVPGPGLQFSQ